MPRFFCHRSNAPVRRVNSCSSAMSAVFRPRSAMTCRASSLVGMGGAEAGERARHPPSGSRSKPTSGEVEAGLSWRHDYSEPPPSARKRRIRSSRRVGSRDWHSQATVLDQPARCKSSRLRVSRMRFSAIFGAENSNRVLGNWPDRHPWPCQKQPWTKIAFLRRGKTMSGLPGKSPRWRRNR